jgi:hypothetical protein
VRRRHHIIGYEGDVHHAADHLLLPGRGKEHHFRLRAGDAQLDPALSVVVRTVRDHAHAELLRVELERAVLIANRDADELDALDHVGSSYTD